MPHRPRFARTPAADHRRGALGWSALAAAALVAMAVTAACLAPAVRLAPGATPPLRPAIAVASLPAPAPQPGTPSAVAIAAGETPAAVIVQWSGAVAGLDGPAAVDLYDATAGTATDTPPLRAVPVAAGRSAVAVLGLDPATTYQAVVTVTGGAGGARRLGPSPAFRLGPDGPVLAGGAAGGGDRATSTGNPGPGCLGAGYGLGAVSVDGWAGVQGSYCLPPAFTAGTGAFCVDHALDYPAGAYRWASTTVGGSAPLVNQYGQAAATSDVARLAWVVGTDGSTADPARAVAVGLIAHAVMGDYPGLSTGDLDPPHLAISGGDPSAIAADAAAMWGASAAAAGPYHVTIDVAPGPYLTGRSYTGSITVTGASGAPVAGVAVGLTASTGATARPDAPGETGSSGSVGFTFTPAAASFDLVASAGSLPPDTLTLWTPQSPPVAVQRVVTAGPPATAGAALPLAAASPGQASLVKVSADPGALPVGAGFSFEVDLEGAAGQWTPVAERSTAASGTMAPITGLAPGTYRVAETAHPAAFLAGGPWTFTLASGQQARWVLTDGPVPRPVRVVKVGDDPALPVGSGVGFALSPAPSPPAHPAPSGAAPPPGPATTLTTGPGGSTPPVELAPGTYRLAETTPPTGYSPAPPLTFTVVPVGAAGPTLQTVTVTDHAIPGVLRLVKTDAVTGAGVAGAVLQVARIGAGGAPTVVGQWTTGVTPLDVPLPPGPYAVSELRPPAGYQAGGLPEQVDLQPGQTLEVTFSDRPLPAPAPTTVPVTVGMAPAAAPVAPAAPASGATLAFTGLPVWRWLLAAAAAVAAGSLLIVAARRRPLRR